MAKRRSTSRRPQPIQFEHWREITGIALLALAVVTLLSLLPTDRGTLTEGWLSFLWLIFGWGMYVVPIGLGAVGLALILDALGHGLEVRPVKVLALGALYVLLLGFLGVVWPASPAVSVPETITDMGAGGYLGALVSELLRAAVGEMGAYILILLLTLVSLSVLSGVSPLEIVAAVATAWQSLKDWYRIRFRLALNNTSSVSQPGLPLLPPQPVAARPANPAPPASVAAPATAAQSARPAPAGKLPLVPHIIGSSSRQSWQLPVIEEIFENSTEHEISQAEIRARVRVIEDTLASFGVPARVIEVNQGPAVTQFGVEPGFVEQKFSSGRVKRVKVKVSKISALTNDLSLALAASPIRIEAPVPGRSIVGIEVPNSETSLVSLRSVMETEAFRKLDSDLKIGLGQDVSGQPAVADLAVMPHLLIAGTTGSGKSVCINSIIACLLCQNTPDDLRVIMVDPKMVELTAYNGIPHLLAPVVIELERIVEVLNWTTQEMDRRYKLFSKMGARNLETYNAAAPARGEGLLPKMVVIIDELADLMMMAPEQVERSICRIAQMARATGIHLVIATQRPSVDVITGLIKANFPARISFAVTSQVDSRVVLDTGGAERLLGRGDMLFMSPDSSKLARLQGCFVSDREINALVRYWKGFRPAGEVKPETVVQPPLWEDLIPQGKGAAVKDDLLDKAIEIVRQHDRASTSLLQRRLRIGYSRAARLIDLLEERGIISGEQSGGRSREVLLKEDVASIPLEQDEQ